MRAMGLRDFTLPADLRPLMPEKALAGPAFTIEGQVVPGADAHETLLAWTGLLSKAPSGSIWVSQPNDRVVAHMGELSAETLKNKGVRGCVADGYIRDANFLLAIGFQAWSRGFTPRDIVGHWLPASVGEPIRIGDVTIASGDFLVGDRDGLLRVPQALVEDVITKAETAMATESLVRKAILAGTDPQEAYLKYGKF
jgi:regulator of RNase E activity RraA